MSWRLILGLPLAGAVVTLLFLAMSGMISVDDFIPGEPGEPRNITITPQIDEPEVERRRPTPPELIDPPAPPETDIDITIDPGEISDSLPGRPRTFDPGDVQIAAPDVAATPVVRVAPSGFERCFAGGTRGEQRVRVRFDISPDGQTSNVEVVASTDSCFERSARQAVQKWRYNPKVEGGQPVWRYGQETVIIYQEGE